MEIFKEIDCSTLESTRVSKAKVLAEIQRIQERIRRHIDDNYVDFMPNSTSSDLYLEQGQNLLKCVEQLNNNREAEVALEEAKTNFKKLSETVQVALLGLRVGMRIMEIDHLFQCMDEAIADKELSVMIMLIDKLKCLIFPENSENTELEETFQKCDCYDAIKVKYHVQVNLLQQNLKQKFEQLLQLTEKSFPQAKSVAIQISKDSSQLQEITLALFKLRYNATQVFSFIMEQCFEPIIRKPVSVDYNEHNSEYFILTLSYSTKPANNNLRPSYAQVFEHIKQVLECLSALNMSFDNEQYVFTLLGNFMKKKFLTLLVDECLMHNIPSTIEKYENSKMVEDVLNFEQYLADCFLIQMECEADRVLRNFAEHFEDYFRTNFTRELIKAANKIMQKDLQDMVLVAEKHGSEDVANKPFLFPRCMVSKSTLELNKLLERIIRQAKENAASAGEGDTVDNYGLSSVITVILNSYAMQVPKLHEKLLESIPQQSALFYNNCMFLANWIALHAEKHIDSLSALVMTLQSTGNKYLNVQIEYQQKIITNILKDFDIIDAHSIGSTPNKLIRQCLRQMELLHNVWQDVLPDLIYNNKFCQILHEFCENIIQRIQSLEDISATVASELSELIDIILEKAPLLFKEKHATLHIKSWQKLQQLKLILNASLLEIVDQWCDGAGPLTANYTSDEVRHMIRALFQNTDRRANALAKIN